VQKSAASRPRCFKRPVRPSLGRVSTGRRRGVAVGGPRRPCPGPSGGQAVGFGGSGV